MKIKWLAHASFLIEGDGLSRETLPAETCVVVLKSSLIQ